MRISDVLRGKAIDGVITIAPEASVRELVALLAEHNVGALIVSTDGSTVAGIVSERDVVRHLHRDVVVLEGPVSAIMTAEVKSCDQRVTLDELMQVMTDHRIRHVPVVEDDALIGIVSIGDVVKNRMAELEFERDQLEGYVHQS